MSDNYFLIVTDLGTKKMLEAMKHGKKLNITHFAVGDGGGTYFEPSADITQLKNEIWRGIINSCEISKEENILTVGAVIPFDIGDFTIREMGIIDEDGILIAICNTPDTQKVTISDGVVHELSLFMELALSNADVVQLLVDTNIVTATKKDLESKVDKVEGKGLSTNDYTTEEKNKLSGIAEGAEVNVQSDWNITDSNSDAYIKNKPQAMKNPNALNISLNGISQGEYDGSTQKEVNITAESIGADSSGTAETKVSKHNVSEEAHADIRQLITELANRLNALADSDDTTLDQLSEIVAYIKNNKDLIDGITTSKVSVADIIDNLTSSATNKPLSAKQGKVLKDLITTLTSSVEGKVSKAGDTMTGTLNSSLSTVSFIDGNVGRAIINSTAKAGAYTMLDRLKSINGYFTDGVWEGKRVFNYTPKMAVDSSVNEVKYQLALLDEAGNSSFPGMVDMNICKVKEDVYMTYNRPNTSKYATPPASGSLVLPDLANLRDYRSFLGTYSKDDGSGWNYLINVRHRNGYGDGDLYGMYIKAPLVDNDNNANLSWGFQHIEKWSKERTILDDINYKKYCLPLLNEYLIAENSVCRILLLSKIGNTDRCGIQAYDKVNKKTGSIEFYNGDSFHSVYSRFNISITKDPEIARSYTFDETGLWSISDKVDLGKSSFKWRNIYAINGTIQTSDRTKKMNINSLDIEKTKLFIMGLIPSSYKMVDGISGRIHYGLIAQDVEELMNTLNMDSKDFAGFIKSPKKIIKYEDENGKKLKNPIEEIIEGEYDYALRYDEFIAPLIKVVQEQQKTIEQQQRIIEQIKNDISRIYSSIER